MTGTDAATIQAVLREHEVVFLAVSDHGRDGAQGGRVAVFLHGNAGEYQQHRALGILRPLPGVRGVEVSAAAWTILVVRLAATSSE